jgi:4-hydroxy-2-oxoheptanedioate aldolase
MNKLEEKMIGLLLELKNQHAVVGIKAEFEAEGTRLDEAMRLKNIVSAAGLALNIKIGGCEAIKDIFDAISLGATGIIAPMVETSYALQKFLRAAKILFRDQAIRTELFINIETITAFKNFPSMLKIPEIDYLNGIVIGRVDFVESMNFHRNEINSEQLLELSLHLASLAKEKGLKVTIGGGVSVEAIPFFNAFPQDHLDRIETRKVIYQCPNVLLDPELALIKAIEFELLWLKNKRNYYNAISHEDDERIKMMEDRYQNSLGKVQLLSEAS